ncbi:MAG: hypothetical protein H8E89_12360 [Candidatus Nitrosopelagicus sp.]|nr:hypothetical protein [Candidatus Nitrosopelagicus sp.]
MNRNIGIATIIGITVIVLVVIFQMSESSYQRSTADEYYQDQDHNDGANIKHVVYPNNPQTMLGLTINKDKYLLGENVFLTVSDIPMGLKDRLQIYSPNQKLYTVIEFDGDEKSSLKHYFRPSLSKQLGLCEENDVVGTWMILFGGRTDMKLNFEVLAETLPHSEEYYQGCNTTAMLIPNLEPTLDE